MTAPTKLSQALAQVVGETPDYQFFYLSDLLGRPVDAGPGVTGHGRIKDVVVKLASPYPQAVGLLLEHGWGKPNAFVPWARVETISPARIALKMEEGDTPYQPYVEQPGWILLKEHLMGQTILDIDGRQTKVVNDVHLLESKRRMLLVHIDVAEKGLLQRVGVGSRKRELISWRVFRPLTVEDTKTDTVMLTVTRKHSVYLPSDDLVEALEQVKRQEHGATEARPAEQPGAAGLPVSKDYVAVPPSLLVGEVLKRMRESAHAPDSISTILVVTPEHALRGVIDLAALVLAPESARIEPLIAAPTFAVTPAHSRPQIEEMFRSSANRILPVLDAQRALVGVVRRADLIR